MSTRKPWGVAAAVVVGVGAIGAIATIPKAAKATAVVDGLSDLRSIEHYEASARMADHAPGGGVPKPSESATSSHQNIVDERTPVNLETFVESVDSAQQVVGFADNCSDGSGFCVDQEPKALPDPDLQKRLGSVQRGQTTMELLRKQGSEVAANFARERELASRPDQPIQSDTAANAGAKRAQLNSIIERGLSSGDDWDAIGRAIQDAFPKADVPRLVEAARKKHTEILQSTAPTAVGRDLGAADLSAEIQSGHR